jgi:hypothetical protein
MADKKGKRLIVVDRIGDWSRTKPFLEGELECNIDIFPETGLARKAICEDSSKNNFYSLVIVDIHNWQIRGGCIVQSRIDFIKEINKKVPVLIYSRAGPAALKRKYGLYLGVNYQGSVFKKYRSERELLDAVRNLI